MGTSKNGFLVPFKSVLLATLALSSTNVALAQITSTPDGTGTIVTPNGNDYAITGGSTSADGSNLFHSFTDFNLLTGESATFLTQPTTQNVLGRVTGGNPSLIDGLLTVAGSEANLFLLNPAGILFGANSALNLTGSFNALTADTVNFAEGSFGAVGTPDYTTLVGPPESFAFSAETPGSIVNEGHLAVNPGQSVVLVGGQVINTGTITAPGGDILITAVQGERLVRIEQAGQLLNLEVATLLTAPATPLPFTPLALPELLTGAPTNAATGVVVAADGTVTLTGSDIPLPNEAGTAIAAGTLKAMPADADGTGGNITLLGNTIGLIDASLDVSGDSGGGTIRVGGDQQGAGSLPNAAVLYVDESSTLTADATRNGDGGRVILWSEESSRLYGDISVQGGALGGDGGFVETSSRGYLDLSGAPQLGAPQGNGGDWLIDPFDIQIGNFGGLGTSAGFGSPFTATAAPAQLDWADLEAAFTGSGVTVTVSTGTGGIGTGDIQILNAHNFTTTVASNLLQLQAADDILVNAGADITATSGLSFNLQADSDNSGIGRVQVSGRIAVPQGDISLSGSTATNQGIDIIGELNTANGTISLIGQTQGATGVLGSTGIFVRDSATLTASDITLTGTSTSNLDTTSKGVEIQGAINTTGDLTIDGSSAGNFGVFFAATTAVNVGQDLTIVGNSTGADAFSGGVELQGNISAQNTLSIAGNTIERFGLFVLNNANITSNGSIQLIGNSTNSTGIFVNALATVTGATGVSLVGNSTSATDTFSRGVEIQGTVSSVGNLNIEGTSSSQFGVFVANSSAVTSGQNLTISGTSTGGFFLSGGVEIQNNLTATNTLSINGTSTNRIGVSVLNNALVNSTGGSVSIRGESTNNTGIFIETTASVSSAGNQSFSGTGGGAGTFNRGVELQGTFTSGGNLSASGSSNNEFGVFVANTAALNATTGAISLTGSSTGTDAFLSRGLEVQGDLNGSSIALQGTSANAAGILTLNSDLIASGMIALNGISNTADAGVQVEATTFTPGSQLDIQGTSNAALAVDLRSNLAFTGQSINITSLQGDIEVASIDAGGGQITITTPSFLRALQVNGGGASLASSGGAAITVFHGGNGITPFIVGDASVNGTVGSITNGVDSILATQAFFPTTVFGNISLITSDDFICILEDCNDKFGDDLDLGKVDESTILVDQTYFEEVAFEASELEAQDSEYTEAFLDYFDNPAIETHSTSVTLVQSALQDIANQTGVPPAIAYTRFTTTPEHKEPVLEVTVIAPNGEPKRFIIPDATQAKVVETALSFRRQILDPLRLRLVTLYYLDSSKQLYDWLIAPIEDELAAQAIGHISFVMAPGLRSLPVAALHNGENFLIEDYSVALMPSLSLTNNRLSNLQTADVLAMGASEFSELPPLDAVPVELEILATSREADTGLNEAFTVENLSRTRQADPTPILHIATHGEFRGTAEEAYIQFWDRQLQLDDIRELQLDAPQLDLLVLSACRTALGDLLAELGFAGLAVQAGARSAVASLWQVGDLQTAGLMAEFYFELGRAPFRAEALRQAQLAMLRGEVSVEGRTLTWEGGSYELPRRFARGNIQHPYYWSGFTVVGSAW